MTAGESFIVYQKFLGSFAWKQLIPSEALGTIEDFDGTEVEVVKSGVKVTASFLKCVLQTSSRDEAVRVTNDLNACRDVLGS